MFGPFFEFTGMPQTVISDQILNSDHYWGGRGVDINIHPSNTYQPKNTIFGHIMYDVRVSHIIYQRAKMKLMDFFPKILSEFNK